MNKEIKAKWVKALRSGEYRQTRQKLRGRNGAMCCIGVLCDIQGAEWGDPSRYKTSDLKFSYAIKGTDEYVDAPKRYIAGVHKKSRRRLMKMNDGIDEFHKHSFAEIADYIEENL